MMARTCDVCGFLIAQEKQEYLELSVKVLKTGEGENQDPEASSYLDCCDRCVDNGTALRKALAEVDYTLVVPGANTPQSVEIAKGTDSAVKS